MVIEHSGELLGEIVTWDTRSGEIPVSTIRDALTANGLSPDVAADLNRRSAFMRATKHLKDNRTIDKVKEEGDVVVFQLTRKEKNATTDIIDFQFDTLVTLDTTTGSIYADNPEVEKIARDAYVHALAVRSASDVTRMVQKLFKENADLFPINPTKGVAYFVPVTHKSFTAKVEGFLMSCGGMVWRFPVPKGTPEGNRSVRDAVASGIRSMLAELRECADDWTTATKAETFKKKAKQWEIVKHKTQSMAEYLQEELTTMMNEVDQTRLLIAQRITALHGGVDEDAQDEAEEQEATVTLA